MRIAVLSAIIFGLFGVASVADAQTVSSGAKPIVDGTGAFGKALVAKLAADSDGRLKKNVHPFVIGYCGWRVRSITNYPLTKYDGAQIGLCRAILNYFDAQLTETLTAIEKNSASSTKPSEISTAESKAIQDFVVMKYGMYYMHLDPAFLRQKPDAIARWKYEVGSNLGEIAAHLTIWWRIWTNDKYEAHVGSLLAGLDDDISSIPKGVHPAFVANLRKLNSLGSKQKFTAVERRQLNDLLTATLVSSVAVADVANINEPIPSGSGEYTRTLSPGVSRTVAELIENGKGLAAKGNSKGAIAVFDQAAELDRGNATVYFYRAIAHEKLGEIDEAVNDYTAVILLRGSLREAYYNRGTIYLNKKDYKLAVSDFDMAINIDPKYLNATYNRGLAHYNLNNLNAALADFINVLKFEPKNVNALVMRSYVYCAQGFASAASKDQDAAAQLGGAFERGCK
jgi:Tfp pilus assembly protein PilF